MARLSDASLDDLRARRPVADVAGRWVSLRRSGGKLIGPCPICSDDRQSRTAGRFEVDGERWVCAVCCDGGDVIRLVEKVQGLDFRAAVAWLGGAEVLDPEEERRRQEERERKRARRERTAAIFREKERERLFRLWQGATPIRGTAAEDYLRLRGLEPPPEGRLRAAREMPYFHGEEPDPRRPGKMRQRVIYTGPAMLAGIIGPDWRFAGLHITWVDPSRPKGKALIVDPETGEVLPVKKVRGSKRGGHIHLAGPFGPEARPTRIIRGEGIETVLSVRKALVAQGADLGATVFQSSVDLGNLGGLHAGTVPHPTLTQVDRAGRARPVLVPGPVPDMSQPGIPVHDSVSDLVQLGDGDSERFLTECALKRGAARYAREGRTIRNAWAPAGADFNDLLEGVAG